MKASHEQEFKEKKSLKFFYMGIAKLIYYAYICINQNEKNMKKNEKIYVLTETDSTDNSWCYNETFKSKEKAVERLKELYHEDVVEREELVVSASISDNGEKASAEMVDGVFLAWNIRECEVQ